MGDSSSERAARELGQILSPQSTEVVKALPGKVFTLVNSEAAAREFGQSASPQRADVANGPPKKCPPWRTLTDRSARLARRHRRNALQSSSRLSLRASRSPLSRSNDIYRRRRRQSVTCRLHFRAPPMAKCHQLVTNREKAPVAECQPRLTSEGAVRELA
jgi:hypothetical protein